MWLYYIYKKEKRRKKMKKINLYSKKEKKIIKSIYAANFKKAREEFNHEFTGRYIMIDDATGIEKICILK